jgi:hypothetical protein
MKRENFKNLVNKELNDEKLYRNRFGKFTKKSSENSNVKMGKSGGGGQYMVEC